MKQVSVFEKSYLSSLFELTVERTELMDLCGRFVARNTAQSNCTLQCFHSFCQKKGFGFLRRIIYKYVIKPAKYY